MNIRISRQHGSVLMVALVISGITGLALMSYLSLLSTEVKLTGRSQVWNTALPLVEAGIEETMAHITVSTATWVTNGWTGSQWAAQMQRNLGDGYYNVTVTNRDNPIIISRGYVRAPLSTGYISRVVRVLVTSKSDVAVEVAAKTTIELNGNKLVADSFDSGDPLYSDSTGAYDVKKRKDGITVTSGSGWSDVVSVGNAEIWGKVATAPGGSVDILKNGVVGSAAFQASGKTGIEPGAFSDDADVQFPAIVAPLSGATPPTLAGGVTLLTNGVYEVGPLTGPLLVTGEATLIVRTIFSISGADAIELQPGAKLNLYVYAPTASFGAGTYNFTSGSRATNFRYYGMPSNTEVHFHGGVKFVGVLYAPDADLTCSGGGKGLNMSGASSTKAIKMGGNYGFHFDEALRRQASQGYVITQWNEL